LRSHSLSLSLPRDRSKNRKSKPITDAATNAPEQRLRRAPAAAAAVPADPRRRGVRAEPVDEPRPRGEAEGVPLQSDPSAPGPVPQVGGLGAPLLRHQLPHYRHPRRRPQRQARSHHRNLGPRKSPRAPQDRKLPRRRRNQ